MPQRHRSILTLPVLLILVTASHTNAQTQTELIARAVFPNVSDDINVLSFHFEGEYTIEETDVNNGGDLPVGSDARTLKIETRPPDAGVPYMDMFGIEDRNDTPSVWVLDDTLGEIPDDSMGIIKLSDTDNFFGVVDPNTSIDSNPKTAVWTFDISDAVGGLTLSIDMAAMGNYNDRVDSFVFETSIDGGSFTPPFDLLIGDSLSHTYTLEDGDMYTFENPMLIDTPSDDPVILDNNFQTFSVPLAGTGEELILRFTVLSENSKAFAFRNIVIEGLTNVVPGGDYNGDGTVNLADYTVWRDSLGMSVDNGTGADGNGNGVIDQGDYNEWKTHFGQSAEQLAGLQIQVPEPASVAVAVLAVGIAACARHRRSWHARRPTRLP